MRGESENRNKELKRKPAADRLSDHRFLANFLRLYLHAAALNLRVRLRRATARPITVNMTDLDRNVPAEARPEPGKLGEIGLSVCHALREEGGGGRRRGSSSPFS